MKERQQQQSPKQQRGQQGYEVKMSESDLLTVMYMANHLLDDNMSLRLLSAANYDYYDAIDPKYLSAFCTFFGRYGLPTVELIGWLKDRIGPRKAIEIGSGAGDLAKHLGIPATDSRIQENPLMAAHYRKIGAVPITYPGWVNKIDACSAVALYGPEVVVASWVTQLVTKDDPITTPGCFAGVNEDQLLDLGVEYIFIGNRAIHGQKRILSRPHEEFELPFLRSRGSARDQNIVYIWKGTR